MSSCNNPESQQRTQNQPFLAYDRLQTLHSFTENFVDVELVLEEDSIGNLILAGTFSPTKAAHHLYSVDLQKTGIDGAGRPTRLELVQEDKLKATGSLFANQPIIEQRINGFSEPFPIYPDGPVTVRLPVTSHDNDGSTLHTQVSVTYMTCSSKGRCLPPVVDKHIDITIPGRFLKN